MKKILLLILVLNSLACLAQTKLDSLKRLLGRSLNDTTLSDLYVKIGNEYQNYSPDSGLLYFNKALDIYNSLMKSGNNTFVSYAVHNTPICNYNMALIYDTYGNYNKALNLCFLSLKEFEKSKFNLGIVCCNNEIGNILSKQKYFDKAMIYYKNSLEISQKNNMKKMESDCYNNIGLVYKNLQNNSKAIEYFNKSIKIDEELNDKNSMAFCYNNLGIVCLEQNNYEQAMKYYLKALDLYIETQDKKGISLISGNIGSIYIELKEYDKAIIESEKSLLIAKEIGALSLEKTAYEILYKGYEGQKKYYQSLQYFKDFKNVNDSIYNLESSKQFKELEFKYQTEKIETENKLQKAILTKNKNIIKYDKIVISFSIGVLIFIISFLIIALKQRKKIKEAYEKLQKTTLELIESEKKSFITDLVVGLAHDLKTPIGNALLSSDTICHESFEIMNLISERRLTQNRLEGFNRKAFETGELIHTEMERISEWVRGFLTISTDQVKNEVRTFNLKEYLDICMNTVHYKLSTQKIKYSIIGDDSVTINTLPGFISQVVLNLINNALEHGFENYNISEKEIKLSFIQKNENVIIECFNNGRHIQQDVLPKIFDDYYTTRNGIKGMGLSSVKRIIEHGLGGTISCISQENSGVTFIIQFSNT